MKWCKLVVALACLAYGAVNPAAAAYPEHAVKIIVPYPAGGGTDAVTRLSRRS